MTLKAMPIGYCKDCRWAEDLPPEMAQDDWSLECTAMPREWRLQVVPQKTVDPKTGQPNVIKFIARAAAYKQKDDFCQFWAPRPIGGDLSEGGLGIGGTGKG